MNKIIINNQEIKLECKEDTVYTTSLDIARVFEKRHTHVLDIIKGIQNDVNMDNFIEPNFRLSEYKDITGRTLPMYNISKDGFSFIAMGLTGQKASRFKIAFINAFNQMESMLRDSIRKQPKELSKLEILEIALETEKENITLRQQIQSNKPLVDFAKSVGNASNAIPIGSFAKLLCDENINIGQNRLFKWFKENKFLMQNNQPYQEMIQKGYFKIIEQTYQTPYGERISVKTLITGKGQIYFTEKLREDSNKKYLLPEFQKRKHIVRHNVEGVRQ